MKVAAALENVPVDAVLSSPCKQTVDTAQPLADIRGLTEQTDADFRERKVGDGWMENFKALQSTSGGL